jgi:hypothetical protein
VQGGNPAVISSDWSGHLSRFASHTTLNVSAISILPALKHRPCQLLLSLLKDFDILLE